MIQRRRNILAPILFLFPFFLSAQELLSLKDAAAIALKNSFGILIANSQVALDSSNATKGNAGYWPTIGLEAGADYGNVFFSNQLLSSGIEENETFAQSWGGSVAIQMDWTIFDGKKMFATYDRLQALTDKSRTQRKADIESVISNVYDAYYAVVFQQSLIDVIDKNLPLYIERESLAKRKWELGSASRLEFLQATLDLKEQQSNKMQLRVDLDDAKAVLNNILSRPPGTQFSTLDTFSVPELPSWDDVISKAVNNKELAVANVQVGIGEWQVKEAEAARKPSIVWSNRLNYRYDQSKAGFFQENNQALFTSGLAIRWNIFDGKRVSSNIQQAKLKVQQYKLAYDQNQQYVQLLSLQSLNRLRNALEQFRFEEESREVAEEAINIAAERYRVGNGTALELKEVQKSYTELEERIVYALYNAKSAETKLHYTMGILGEK